MIFHANSLSTTKVNLNLPQQQTSSGIGNGLALVSVLAVAAIGVYACYQGFVWLDKYWDQRSIKKTNPKDNENPSNVERFLENNEK